MKQDPAGVLPTPPAATPESGRFDRVLLRVVFPAAAAAALILLAAICVRVAAGNSIRFDDAFIASVAKNLADGNGYSSSYYSVRPFDVEITTGPALVLPAAALMRVFGNQYWVPNVAFTLCLWACLAVLAGQARGRLGRGQLAPFVVVLAFGLSRMWREFELLGEIPAALLAGLAAMVLTRTDVGRGRAVVGAGLLAGAAITTKAVCALVLPLFVAWILFSYRGRARWTALAQFFAGLAAPLCAMALWRLTAAWGPHMQLRELLYTEWSDIFHGNSTMSGVSTLRGALDKPEVLRSVFERNLPILLAWWGRLPLIGAVLLAAVLVWATRRSIADSSARRLAGAAYILLGAAMVHAAWWLLLAPFGWTRHLLPAAVYWLVAIAILTAQTVSRGALVAGGAFLTTILIVASALSDVAAPREHDRGYIADLASGSIKSPRLAALLETTEFVRNLQSDGSVILIGCGWWHNPDVEYLLPRSGNFRDCLRLRPSEVAGKRLILVHSEFFGWENLADPHNPESAMLSRFRETCERQVLFSRRPFVVSECSGLPD